MKTSAADLHPFHAVKWLYYRFNYLMIITKTDQSKICCKVNLQVGIMGMKLFCERIHVTWSLQVHAHVVEINSQKTRGIVRVEYAYTYPYKFECSTSLMYVLWRNFHSSMQHLITCWHLTSQYRTFSSILKESYKHYQEKTYYLYIRR